MTALLPPFRPSVRAPAFRFGSRPSVPAPAFRFGSRPSVSALALRFGSRPSVSAPALPFPPSVSALPFGFSFPPFCVLPFMAGAAERRGPSPAFPPFRSAFRSLRSVSCHLWQEPPSGAAPPSGLPSLPFGFSFPPFCVLPFMAGAGGPFFLFFLSEKLCGNPFSL